MRKVAKKIGLVDRPNERKLHSGAIPLVGGLSICISLLYFIFNNPSVFFNAKLYAVSILILVGVGVLDDRFDISFKVRFAVQAALSVAMMVVGGMELRSIGNVFGSGDVLTFSWFGHIVTILAVVGIINAFNMVDGIDGLLGGLSMVTFGSLGILLLYRGQHNIAYACLAMIVAIIPYMLLNLEVFGRKCKVFMGDAGSMLIGFTVIWFLLVSTQGIQSPVRPVTALWLIAVPLMDMVATMIRRIRQGNSPFKPDREHLHHTFQDAGLSSTQTFITITVIALFYAVVGIAGEIYDIPEYIMLYSFAACFGGYLYCLAHIGKLGEWPGQKK